ncbi:hypothetical protein SAMN05444158_1244 [Bradyrhizobium canariense]|uniref:Uncharacterized protein n=1 Tax=Bradyrhizobium canariense TaxID=255045 RepID=A0A1H1Q3R2_9BRAD|nr:hypothetical protein SAMN05444158_1244 [Bradyrhizobium canariense]
MGPSDRVQSLKTVGPANQGNSSVPANGRLVGIQAPPVDNPPLTDAVGVTGPPGMLSTADT